MVVGEGWADKDYDSPPVFHEEPTDHKQDTDEQPSGKKLCLLYIACKAV